MYTDHTLPSDSIMTVDACDRRLVRKTGSLADLKHKEKEQRGRFGEIDEKISREEYTLDWSQSKVFLVTVLHFSSKLYHQGIFRSWVRPGVASPLTTANVRRKLV